MKKFIFLTFFISYSIFAFSQKAPLKWKKLTKEEIDLKVYNNNPNIPAVILYDYGQMYFDLNPNGNNLFLFNKRHVRIKILNKSGLKYAKVKFLYNDMNCEYYSGELSFSVKAVTHNILENGKIKTTKVKYRNITHRDSTGCLKVGEFEFKDVKVGSILEYIITIPSFKLINPNTWFFQQSIPVIYSEFRARIPNNFEYIFSVKNVSELFTKDSSFYDQVLNYSYKYNINSSNNSVINMSGIEYRFINKYMPSITNKNKIEKINIHLKYIKSRSNDYAWQKISKALMITTHYDYEKRTPSQRQMLLYPSGFIIYYLPTWEELNENLQHDDKFGLAIIKYWDCDSILSSIIKPNQNEKSKVNSIYNFVKANMKWNNKYSIYADVSDNLIKKLYSKSGGKVKLNNIGNYFEDGIGSSAEINFVLMYLLNKAKIKTYPVLVNNKDCETIDKNIPDIKQFKTVLALVYINNKPYLLDAANTNSTFNKISDQYDKTKMFVIKNDGYLWISEK